MSVRVNSLIKTFGSQKALDGATFQINQGQIVGLLGPNGAGKSTMMKILTCFIPPTSGEAYIHDLNVMEDSLEVRRLVGYLPEHNPLYLEMYVREYLEFIGGIHKISNLHARVDEMIEITGLSAEYRKKIGTLSKGYRQRVGLAQALIHDPKVLILDEPTSGLDPNQLTEIRKLIKEVGKQKTVMLSTHIMQEVEALCDRAIIINNGKIVADDLTENLHKISQKEEILLVEFDKPVNEVLLKSIQNIVSIEKTSENSWKIIASSQFDIRPIIFQFAIDNKLTVLSLSKQEHTLEEVFRQVTKN